MNYGGQFESEETSSKTLGFASIFALVVIFFLLYHQFKNFVEAFVILVNIPLAIIGGVVSVATIIVKLTPTQKDDAVLGKIIAVLSALSLVNTDGSFVGAKK